MIEKILLISLTHEKKYFESCEKSELKFGNELSKYVEHGSSGSQVLIQFYKKTGHMILLLCTVNSKVISIRLYVFLQKYAFL